MFDAQCLPAGIGRGQCSINQNPHMRSILKIFLLSFSLLFPLQTFAQRAVPEHGGVWVHDEAKVLSPSTVTQLERILKAERDSTSNQIAILIVPSLEGEDIDGFSIRVAKEWKAGDVKKDNGVIFIVAIQDRKMRIEVGQGLQGVLTDALSSRINRNQVAPQFRQGNYDAGIIDGTMAIIQAIKGEYKNTEPPKRKRGGKSPWGTILFIILLIIIMSRRGGGGLGGYWAAGMMGSMLGGGGRSGGSWDSGSDYGGGGGFDGGGSSDSW
jgi:uncharacterized protein